MLIKNYKMALNREADYNLTSFLGKPYMQEHDPFEDPIKMCFQEPEDVSHLRIIRGFRKNITIQNTAPPYKIVHLSSYNLIKPEERLVEVTAPYDKEDLIEIMRNMGYNQGFGTSKELNHMAAGWVYSFNHNNLENMIQ